MLSYMFLANDYHMEAIAAELGGMYKPPTDVRIYAFDINHYFRFFYFFLILEYNAK